MAPPKAKLGSRRANPFAVVGVVVTAAGLYGALHGRAPSEPSGADGCAETADAACGATPSGESLDASPAPAPSGPVLSAAEACRNVGYLCADLARADRIRVQRWTDFHGPMVVYVPRPDFEDPGVAAQLQQAAVIGLRAWNNQPFQILTDVRGDRDPLFAVTWTRVLGANRLGVAHTQWSSRTGLRVVSIELTTRNPFAPDQVIGPEQVRLTAAHEMGHALGLPHSDSPRDVMYPTNTATSLTAQDYRTMESLYGLRDGTEIVR